MHTAWFLKSKGADIDGSLRQIANHHTKGMIVDGKRVLIGSHNWSKPGEPPASLSCASGWIF
jgi:phosphatidylserine/phosphatidylglycerophosphate/cardiolipin synthase-like enzyme